MAPIILSCAPKAALLGHSPCFLTHKGKWSRRTSRNSICLNQSVTSQLELDRGRLFNCSLPHEQFATAFKLDSSRLSWSAKQSSWVGALVDWVRCELQKCVPEKSLRIFVTEEWSPAGRAKKLSWLWRWQTAGYAQFVITHGRHRLYYYRLTKAKELELHSEDKLA